MSLMKDYVDNLTDEQILSSAYMCCQRNAIKFAYQNLIECRSNTEYLQSRDGRRQFKTMHRQTHYSINYWEYLKRAFVVFFISIIVYTFVEALWIPVNYHTLTQALFKVLWILIATFPILRRIFIEVDISRKYGSLTGGLKSSVEKNMPDEVKYAEQLTEIEDYLEKNCVIPKKYWDYALNIAEYIYVDFRATNLREAINILEEDLHRNRLENKMSEIEELAVDNANAIEEMMERIDNIECFQDYLESRQNSLERQQSSLASDVRLMK